LGYIPIYPPSLRPWPRLCPRSVDLWERRAGARVCIRYLLDDVDDVKAEFDAALGVVGSRVGQAAHGEVAVSEQMYPQAVILLTHKPPPPPPPSNIRHTDDDKLALVFANQTHLTAIF